MEYPTNATKVQLTYVSSIAFTNTDVKVLDTASFAESFDCRHDPIVPQGFLELLSPNEVFACENGTTFIHQDESFFLAVGEDPLLVAILLFAALLRLG